ncbi:MAG: amino acid kinase family protein, partial [bacterium]
MSHRKVVIQKYGGTSLANPQRIKEVAHRVVEERKSGNDVIVVVSAMGDSTDI